MEILTAENCVGVPRCDECGEAVAVVALIGPDDDNPGVKVCIDCLEYALEMAVGT